MINKALLIIATTLLIGAMVAACITWPPLGIVCFIVIMLYINYSLYKFVYDMLTKRKRDSYDE